MRNTLSVLTISLLAALPAPAGTVSLAPTRDATLVESDEGRLADARGPHLRAGRTAQGVGSTRRALLAFDVAGAVPRGAGVLGVTLILYKSGGLSVTTDITLHRVTRDWGEGG